MNNNYDINTIKIILTNINYCIEWIDELDDIEFNNNKNSQYALCMALQIICENCNHISQDLKEKYSNINWKDISTIRNIISHEYGALDLSIVYKTIKNDLPVLKSQLEEVLNDINN